MSADAERLRDTIRHEWSYVRRYLENTGGPTLKIHLARLEAALAMPEPEPTGEPSTSDGTELYRPSRICVSDYVVTDHAADAADLLDRAASIMNELARRGAFAGDAFNADPAAGEVARWFTEYDGLARR
jgi:hypothetical protein